MPNQRPDHRAERGILPIIRDIRQRWRLRVMLTGAAVVLAVGLATFVFFSWLEQRALDQVSGRARRTLKEQVPQIPWALAGGFLVAPFLVLALLSPKVAALLLLVVILTPLAFSRLDGE